MPLEYDIEQDFAEAVRRQRRRDLVNLHSPVTLALRRKLRVMAQVVRSAKRKTILLRSNIVHAGGKTTRRRLDAGEGNARAPPSSQAAETAVATAPTPLARAGEGCHEHMVHARMYESCA